MRKTKLLYVLGVAVGLSAAVMLVPEARRRATAFVLETSERVRAAWEEGKRAKRRREHELEEVVHGHLEPGAEEDEAPDYIV